MTFKNQKNFSYAKLVPTLVADNADALSEIARWVLEMNDLLYIKKLYAPGFSTQKVNKVTGASGYRDNPALINTDALVYTPESIINYIDIRNPQYKQLFPDPTTDAGKEVKELYDLFVGPFNDAVNGYLYSELFTSKKNAKALFKQQLSGFQKLAVTFRLGHIKKGLNQQYGFESKNPQQWLAGIEDVFIKMSNHLAQNKSTFLVGNQLTAADIAFSAVAGRLLIPMEYGSAITNIEDISYEFRTEVFKLRKYEAGQFALRIYQQERPQPDPEQELPDEPGFFSKLMGRILGGLTSGQYKVFAFLAKRLPVINIGLAKLSIVSRFDLVTEVLHRNLNFTVEEINGKKMADQNGAFYLGFDSNNPQFGRERDFVRKATRSDDLKVIRETVRNHVEEITQKVGPLGKMDVVSTMNNAVLAGLLETYFGIPAPSTKKMVDWSTAMFYDLFLNLTNDEEIHEKALEAARARRKWILKLIAERKEQLKTEGSLPQTNILNRLITQQHALQQENPNQDVVGIWYDDEMIRRNMGGLVTGLVATSSKAVVLTLEKLFSLSGETLNQAIKTAKSITDPAHQILNVDINPQEDKAAGRPTADEANPYTRAMYGYIAESLRFNPVQPGVIRYCENEQYLMGEGSKKYKIKGKRKVLTLTSGAMFTESAFPEPKSFNPQRIDEGATYMNWGYALHRCYGNYINMVTIPEMVAAVLRLPGVQPEKGRTGRGAGLKEGPFPVHYVVKFNPTSISN